MFDEIIELAKAMNDYGPVLIIIAALLVLNGSFIWRDFRRESKQQHQIEELQRIHNDTIIPLLTDCKEAIAGCREVISQNSTIITGWLQRGHH